MGAVGTDERLDDGREAVSHTEREASHTDHPVGDHLAEERAFSAPASPRLSAPESVPDATPAWADQPGLYVIYIDNPHGDGPRMQVLHATDDCEAQDQAATALFGDLGDACGHVFKGEKFAFTVYPSTAPGEMTPPRFDAGTRLRGCG